MTFQDRKKNPALFNWNQLTFHSPLHWRTAIGQRISMGMRAREGKVKMSMTSQTSWNVAIPKTKLTRYFPLVLTSLDLIQLCAEEREGTTRT